jgi:flagellar motor switch protein FliN/FliY
MIDEMLTQEQIDAHFKKMQEEENAASGEKPVSDFLSEDEVDIIGEAANIFIATSATTLSMILDKRVRITTPVVTVASIGQIYENMAIPYVALKVGFKEGINGENLLLLKTADASVISDIMMGGDGSNIKVELDEIEISAVSEAMNQMIGSATTSMATMLNRLIDIGPPEVDIWQSFDQENIDDNTLNENFIQIAFNMTIDGVLESNIMQLYSVNAVRDIVEAFKLEVLADTGEDVSSVAINEDVNLKDEVEEVESFSSEVMQEDSGESAIQNANVNMEIPERMNMLLDVMLDLTVVFGSTRKTIRELLSFGEGSVIELDKYIDEPLEIFVNNKLIGFGEVVVVDENFGIRITSLVDIEDRIS